MVQRKSTSHRTRSRTRTTSRKRTSRNTHTLGVGLTGILLLAVAGLALFPLEQQLMNGISKSTSASHSSQSTQRRYVDEAAGIAFNYPATWRIAKQKNGLIIATRQAGLQFAPKGEKISEPSVTIGFTDKENPGLDLPVGTSCNRQKDARLSGRAASLMVCTNDDLTIELYNVLLGNNTYAFVKTSFAEERDGLVINDIVRSLSMKAPAKK